MHSFLLNATKYLIIDFWKNVSIEFKKRVYERKNKLTWLNTSGLGVYWLHMRIDDTPKYYRYNKYKGNNFINGSFVK